MRDLRTKFFRGFDPTLPANSSFPEDIRHLLSLDEGTVDGCVDILVKLAAAESAASTREIAAKFFASRPQPGLMQAIRCLEFLSRIVRDEQPGEVALDILTLVKDIGDSETKLVRILDRLKQSLVRELPKRLAFTGVGPTFESIQSTVDLRAVQAERFQFGQDLKDYRPKVDDVVGIISVRISRDMDRDVFFQATRQQVVEIVMHLQSAIEDLDALLAHHGAASRLKAE